MTPSPNCAVTATQPHRDLFPWCYRTRLIRCYSRGEDGEGDGDEEEVIADFVVFVPQPDSLMRFRNLAIAALRLRETVRSSATLAFVRSDGLYSFHPSVLEDGDDDSDDDSSGNGGGNGDGNEVIVDLVGLRAPRPGKPSRSHTP
ncbi:hypothetical protein CSUB01_10230 [Colletotrichum sublineola]|uniref:Uncharacterized protein n=1 Tax=Colletotrichum sublineola TaxID=1173701 RepID=A0A066XTJ6_COLSU|nr:hypothetical protein CSUB01_10230 [Colletotrichum sublineola]